MPHKEYHQLFKDQNLTYFPSGKVNTYKALTHINHLPIYLPHHNIIVHLKLLKKIMQTQDSRKRLKEKKHDIKGKKYVIRRLTWISGRSCWILGSYPQYMVSDKSHTVPAQRSSFLLLYRRSSNSFFTITSLAITRDSSLMLLSSEPDFNIDKAMSPLR